MHLLYEYRLSVVVAAAALVLRPLPTATVITKNEKTPKDVTVSRNNAD